MWFKAVAIIALLWNLLGCAAFFADLRLTPDDLAKLSAAQQAMYAARPMWSIAATGIAVLGGALGCLGLLLGKRWCYPLLGVSLLGVIVQDISMFAEGGAAQFGSTAVVLQGLVLLIAIGLVLLARRASARGWLS